MSTVKGKKILCWDQGIFLEHALALARAGAEVTYFTPWASTYPEFHNYATGVGYEDEGLTKSLYFWPHVEDADMIFFPDVGQGDIAQYLRKAYPDKPIFGSALGDDGGNKLEQDRHFMRGIQEKMGLPTQKSDKIVGVPALRDYLKKNESKFVKLNIFRGDIESFQAKSYDAIKLRIDEIESALGPFSQVYEFLVEDFIEGIEPGFDCLFTNGDWVRPYLWGIEQSKACYLGKFVDTLPKPLQLIADKLKPVLSVIDYRGAISIECRIDKKGDPYLIDICTRFPAPLSALYPLAFENYPEVIWNIGAGKPVQIKNAGTYAGMVPLKSDHAKLHYVRLEFPEEYRKYIKTIQSAKVKDKFYGARGNEELFACCVAGNNWHKLIPALEVLAKKCDAFGLDLDSLSGLHRIEEVVSRYQDYGMGDF